MGPGDVSGCSGASVVVVVAVVVNVVVVVVDDVGDSTWGPPSSDVSVAIELLSTFVSNAYTSLASVDACCSDDVSAWTKLFAFSSASCPPSANAPCSTAGAEYISADESSPDTSMLATDGNSGSSANMGVISTDVSKSNTSFVDSGDGPCSCA